MTIKRGRWAARIPGLRWGGQQVPRGPRVVLDFESFGFDVGHKDATAFVVAMKEGDGPVKIYPYQEAAITMLLEGTGNLSFQRGLGRARAFERDFYKEAVENWRKSGLIK